MKKITYKERSMFYTNELQKNDDDIILLKLIKNKYNIKISLLCPCASGIYLAEFSKFFEKSYFVDIERSMIKEVKKNMLINHISNIETAICNMININNLNIKCDCIFSLNQGIQYLNYLEFEKFLNNVYFVTNYVVLSLFDFDQNGTLTYYNSQIADNSFYYSKSFLFMNKIIKRYNMHIHYDDFVNFWYFYYSNEELIFQTTFKLYNYKYNLVKKIVDKNGKFYIHEKFSNKNGTYAIVLAKKELIKYE